MDHRIARHPDRREPQHIEKHHVDPLVPGCPVCRERSLRIRLPVPAVPGGVEGRLGVAEGDVTYATVPGALELPLTLQVIAQSGRFDALVALGAVIRGETYHFEIVSNESARGITDVQLNSGIPIANAVLTTENDDQALVRMAQKGAEAAQAAIEMANLTKALAKAPR